MRKILIFIFGIVGLVVIGGIWLYAQPLVAPAQQEPQPQPQISTTSHPVATPLVTSTPIIGTPTLTPGHVIVNTPTTVTVNVPIADPTLIAASVNLLRLNATGVQPSVLGQLQGNASGTYAIQVPFDEPAAGQIQLEVSAAFKGFLRRATSTVATGLREIVWVKNADFEPSRRPLPRVRTAIETPREWHDA